MKWFSAPTGWAVSAYRWLRDWWRYRLYRIKQARALRKSQEDDPNVYPLW